MSVEHLGIFPHLSADAGVSALVADRIYPVILPQKPTYPAITFGKVSGLRAPNLSGPSGLARPRISISSWGLTYKSAKDVATAVRQAMDGFSGLMGSVRVKSVTIDNEFDLFEDDDNVNVFRTLQDFFISHDET